MNDRFAITHTKQWTTIDGDSQGAVLKNLTTGETCLIIGGKEWWQRIVDALNRPESAHAG